MIRPICILLIVLVSGCASPNYYGQLLSSWQGKPIQKLLNQWGPPSQIMPIPAKGGHVYYIYASEQTQTYQPPPNVGFVTINTTSNQKPVTGTIIQSVPPSYFQLKCTTWFEVNQQNQIVAANAKGNYCYASEQQINELGNVNPTGKYQKTR